MPRLTKEDADIIMNELTQDSTKDMTPWRLLEKLDQHIVSQGQPKKLVAQAIRNKFRMQKIDDPELRGAMRPSNILVHGRSGSGKTEIFRVVAKLYRSPMIRVEATRYTEVGYHGDDVTNIIVDLFKKSKHCYSHQHVHSLGRTPIGHECSQDLYAVIPCKRI